MSFNRRTLPAGSHIGTWTAADGWPHRTLEWPSEGRRGSLLFLGGRGDIFEKYLETFDHWNRAGWNVTVHDRDTQIGGMLSSGLPPFRFDKRALDRRRTGERGLEPGCRRPRRSG